MNSPINFGPIPLVHRHDGYVSIAVRSFGEWRTLMSLRVDEFDSMLPEIYSQIEKDSFISLNASYRRTATHNRGNQCRSPFHQANTLRYLCTCYCDIDFYKLGLTFNEAYKQVMDWAEAQHIPFPSISINSGRGMWLLWLLRDPDRPQQAHCGAFADNPLDHLQLYLRIQRELASRLSLLGADFQALDATRHVRIPGSFHTGSEQLVRWNVHGQWESVNTYTLLRLAELLGIQLRQSLPSERKALVVRPAGAKLRAWMQANANKLAVITALRELRNGFTEGHRSSAAWLYALTLRLNKASFQEAVSMVVEMGKECRPPLARSDCERHTRSAYRKNVWRKISYQKMADLLDVSPDEAKEVSELIGKPFPAAGRSGVVPINPEPGRAEAQKQRREQILLIVKEEQRTPSLRKLKQALFNIGIAASVETLRSDCAALSLQSIDLKRRRKLQAERERQLQIEIDSPVSA